jgi:hypothetical protein
MPTPSNASLPFGKGLFQAPKSLAKERGKGGLTFGGNLGGNELQKVLNLAKQWNLNH